MSEKKHEVNFDFEEKLAHSTEKDKSRGETLDSNEKERNQTNNKKLTQITIKKIMSLITLITVIRHGYSCFWGYLFVTVAI